MNTLYKYIYGFSLIAMAGLSAGCDDVLDAMPDNRTRIDTPEKVKQIMTGAYPVYSPIEILELFADNLVDNNVEVAGTHKSAQNEYQAEAFRWEDIKTYSPSNNDTPYKIWTGYYGGIAVCNQTLLSIEEMEKKNPEVSKKINAYKGEALVLRAYLHFWLVNIFGEVYVSEEQSKNALGIPYTREVENVDIRKYDRQSVAEVYQMIEEDLLEGLPLIDDSFYDVRTFHMNSNAANAFAARFYLYKHDWAKADYYATKALGSTPSASLRNWSTLEANTVSNDMAQKWLNEKADATNYLLSSTYSTYDRMISNGRFAYNGSRDGANSGKSQYQNAPAAIVYGYYGPNWTGYSPWFEAGIGCTYISGEQKYGVYSFMLSEYFEYTDKIAGIGYVHMISHPLTADQTLLERAEARLYMGDKAGCIADLDMWCKSHLVTKDLTEEDIVKFYTAANRGEWRNDIHAAELGWSPADAATIAANKPLVDCLLHFRRCETLYDGMRWFDVRRYGIQITHRWLGPHEDATIHDADKWNKEQSCHVDSLTWNDPRRVIQIPYNVIDAGLTPTGRLLWYDPNNRANDGYQVSSSQNNKFEK